MTLPAATALPTRLPSVAQVDGALVPKMMAASRVRAMAGLHQRPDRAPDVEAGVVEDRLGDRDDGRDLLDVHVLVVPRGLGGLLQAGVTGHEVGGRAAPTARGTGSGSARSGCACRSSSTADCADRLVSIALETSSGTRAAASERDTKELYGTVTS